MMVSPLTDNNRSAASELYALALEQQAQRNYQQALKSYERSLALHDDAIVRAAYFRLLSMIGPK